MTEEEKKAQAEAETAKVVAEAKAKEDAKAAAAASNDDDEIALKDKEIARLTEERDNYKVVALKRLGKLPADSEFLGENGEDIQSILEEKIKVALLDRDINRQEKEKEDVYKKTLRENSELRLALKNRPNGSIGGDSGASSEVKDNVFSPEQIVVLKQKAERLKLDPDKFVENAKKNFLARK